MRRKIPDGLSSWHPFAIELDALPIVKASQTTNPGYVGRYGGSMDTIEVNTSMPNDDDDDDDDDDGGDDDDDDDIMNLRFGANTKSNDRQASRLSKVKH